MRVVVFSDIHGNALALEAVLDDLGSEAYDSLVCLGDAVQGGPQPAEVVALLRRLGCPVVMGNADDWLLTGQDSGAETFSSEQQQRMDEVRAWQLSILSEADLNFIRAFRATVDFPLGGGRTLRCYHGSPGSFDDVILPGTDDATVRAWLAPQENVVYCGGHTHMQFVRHFGRTFHFNPGSVGLAYRHDQDEATFRLDPWAEYAVLTYDERGRLEFRRVPVDVARLADLYRASGKPHTEASIAQLEAH